MEEVLQPGSYSWPFSFQLPPQLPGSYESNDGCIRYMAKAIVDLPMKIDKTAMFVFTVTSVLDLNLEHTAKVTVIFDETQQFQYCIISESIRYCKPKDSGSHVL